MEGRRQLCPAQLSGCVGCPEAIQGPGVKAAVSPQPASGQRRPWEVCLCIRCTPAPLKSPATWPTSSLAGIPFPYWALAMPCPHACLGAPAHPPARLPSASEAPALSSMVLLPGCCRASPLPVSPQHNQCPSPLLAWCGCSWGLVLHGGGRHPELPGRPVAWL